ncbi:uncharacterized protein LOC108278455 [Ictalurus punctatus]|uniref:Uncharacterized protein LOC108278455 n=1 Tax=Ictalurus punctatus TaxID=7998 RepID=A0A2D0SXT6_ICTPU|nr:uncharacterized protein LOC108278455 [Ictalurus punctatus]
MAHVSSFWLQWGMACSVFALVFAWVFALVFAQDSSWDCSDRDDILRDAPVDVSTPSRCTLDCTARTYRAVLELHNRLTIRFTDSRAVEPEEYCWPSRIKCSPGQRLQSAFILLPVDSSVVDSDPLRLQINSETNGATVRQHAEYSLLPAECGLRFDVTEHIPAQERQENLCVKIIAREQSTLGNGLMCPPFLVTTWEKWNRG